MLNAEAQIRYLVQWFNEWSELQRSDFLPIMAERYANKVYVNGIVNSISNVDCRDKPMSLFECRVKLFKEWFLQWSIEQKENFLKQITDIDATFADKLNGELGVQQNGVSNNDHVNHVAINGQIDHNLNDGGDVIAAAAIAVDNDDVVLED